MVAPDLLDKKENYREKKLNISFKLQTGRNQNTSEAWGIIFLIKLDNK